MQRYVYNSPLSVKSFSRSKKGDICPLPFHKSNTDESIQSNPKRRERNQKEILENKNRKIPDGVKVVDEYTAGQSVPLPHNPKSPATYANNDSHEFFIGSGDGSDESGHLLESQVDARVQKHSGVRLQKSRYGRQIKIKREK